MLGIALRALAFLMFFIAGCDQTVFNQSPVDWIAFGLAAWVLATLIGGYDFGVRLSRSGE